MPNFIKWEMPIKSKYILYTSVRTWKSDNSGGGKGMGKHGTLMPCWWGSVRHSAEQSRSAKLISICFHNLNKGELLDKG